MARMSFRDKVQETRRRLAAISFLYNISLNGTYKDSNMCGSGSRGTDNFSREAALPAELIVSSDTRHIEISTVRAKGSEHPGFQEVSDQARSNSLGEQGAAFEKRFHDANFTRRRANTGIGEGGYLASLSRQAIADSDAGFHGGHNQKRAHFSSTESLDHGGIIRASNVNISDLSLQHCITNTKMVNLRIKSSQTFKDQRLVILVSQRTPLVIFSTLSYSRNNRQNRLTDRSDLNRRTRNASGSRPISSLSDPDPLETLVLNSDEEVSYGHLLQPRKANNNAGTSRPKCKDLEELAHNLNTKHFPVARCVSYDAGVKLQSGVSVDSATTPDLENHDSRHISPFSAAAAVPGGCKASISAYSPHMLDDPEFRAGKHRTLLTFPSYITSVIDYCKAADMKKELNDKFKDRFPHIHLTLSKLRSLKREMRKVAKAECNIDLLTVAQAYVYFEKLILGSFVTKHNRKFCAGACLLLSAKLNDVKGYSLHNLIEMIERTFRVNRKELLCFEFAVLVALEFTLHLPTWEVFPHYQRLMYES